MSKRKAVVEAVSLNSRLFSCVFSLFVLLFSSPCLSAGTEPPSENAVPPSVPVSPEQDQGCREFTAGEASLYAPFRSQEGVGSGAKKLLEGLSSKNASAISSLTHPRLGVSAPDLQSILITMKLALGNPFEVSLFRLWHITGAEAFLKDGVVCPGSEVRIFPHYGYESQWALWVQVLGQKELGRVFVTFIPEKGTWWLGYFHFHKWSHAEKDPRAWISEADSALRNGNLIAARVGYTLAQRLLGETPHFVPLISGKLRSYMDENIPQETWLTLIRKSLPGEVIAEGDALFVKEGAGLGLTFRLPEEKTGPEVREHCQMQLSLLSQKIWFRDFSGLRCSYLAPNEPDAREGRMGSLYLPRVK